MFTIHRIEEDYFEVILHRKFVTDFTNENFRVDITLMPEFPIDGHNNDNSPFSKSNHPI